MKDFPRIVALGSLLGVMRMASFKHFKLNSLNQINV